MSRGEILKPLLPVAIAVLCFLGSAQAASVWYIATTGNDLNTGISPVDPFKTIQHGIDQATSGDTIIVQEGTYDERISFYSKAITVGSWILRDGDTLHILNTIIDGNPTGLPVADTTAVVRFINGGSGESSLIGFTITGSGSGVDGVFCVASRPALLRCVFEDCDMLVRDATPGPSARECRFNGGGIRVDSTTRVEVSIGKSIVDGGIVANYQGFPDYIFHVDSSTIGKVDLSTHGILHSRHTTFQDSIVGSSTCRAYLTDCVVRKEVYFRVDSRIEADSCQLNGIGCGGALFAFIRRSIIDGPLKLKHTDTQSFVSLYHSTIVDSIYWASGIRRINWQADTCIFDLPAPIAFDSFKGSLRLNCCDVYAGGQPWLSGVPDPVFVLDTLQVITLPPQFCDPCNDDFRIFDTSPCSPSNNTCGVLIGAKEIGCYTKRVWHVSTGGDDSCGTGSLAQPFATIQNGIDRAAEGDTVLVEDGTYHERISFMGKSIIVGSWILTDGNALHAIHTIIDANPFFLPPSDTLNAVRFVNGMASPATLKGFTIQGGDYGILSFQSRPSIESCYLIYGGARIIDSSQFTDVQTRFTDCRFIGCGMKADCSGIVALSHCIVEDSIIGVTIGMPSTVGIEIESSTVSAISMGHRSRLMARATTINGGVHSGGFAYTDLIDCRVTGRLEIGGESGLNADSCDLNEIYHPEYYSETCRITRSLIRGPFEVAARPIELRHCTVLNLKLPTGQHSTMWVDSSIVILATPMILPNLISLHAHCSDFFEPGGQPFLGAPINTIDTAIVFSLDPGFCDPANGDYHLLKSSPCAPSHNDCGILIGALDICGDCGDANGSGIVNISDAVYLVNYIFAGGPAPNPLASGDANCSGGVNISDAVYLINYIFSGGAAPCAACP